MQAMSCARILLLYKFVYILQLAPMGWTINFRVTCVTRVAKMAAQQHIILAQTYNILQWASSRKARIWMPPYYSNPRHS